MVYYEQENFRKDGQYHEKNHSLCSSRLFVVIMMLPATPVPAKEYHPLPVWSILCYLATVAISALAVVWIRLEKRAVAIAQ